MIKISGSNNQRQFIFANVIFCQCYLFLPMLLFLPIANAKTTDFSGSVPVAAQKCVEKHGSAGSCQ